MHRCARKILALLDPAVRTAILDVAELTSKARRARDNAVVRALRQFAACCTLSSSDVAQVLGCLSYSHNAQIAALIVLWGAVTDKANLALLMPALGNRAVHALMQRLGFFNFMRCVRWPFGCHFAFDLANDADQAAAARQLCANANTVQPLWGDAFADVKLQRSLADHAKQQTQALASRQAVKAQQAAAKAGTVAAPESLADLVPSETIQKRSSRRAAAASGTVSAAQSSEDEAKTNFRRYMRALWDLEEPSAVVFENITVDGEPLVGRAKIHLQHLWADVSGHYQHLELDFVPYDFILTAHSTVVHASSCTVCHCMLIEPCASSCCNNAVVLVQGEQVTWYVGSGGSKTS